ncbi:hypothetical protein ALC60_02471 [Trachymyrmex zeteki]|uniref:Uncharacterized protein n=1 Tax=Mycetomoellerius zeteki TaxID=64791 RepID=A0A151XEL8_9HYME|nr:hypothetical protein ALC60_02471 [Trachymyrmex zeteki]
MEESGKTANPKRFRVLFASFAVEDERPGKERKKKERKRERETDIENGLRVGSYPSRLIPPLLYNADLDSNVMVLLEAVRVQLSRVLPVMAIHGG